MFILSRDNLETFFCFFNLIYTERIYLIKLILDNVLFHKKSIWYRQIL